MGIGYPPIWRDDIKKFDMWSSEGEEFKWASAFDSFKSEIVRFISEHNNGTPFAIYIWDLLSHLVYMNKKKSEGTNFLREEV
ncbi:hypothetical protein HMSSN036_23660 [Paenibacillus macerans]|nr:hypothetical protein HMSSN036_23660 [Paenibacillus macerans]